MVVGVLARLDATDAGAVRQRLAGIDGVEVFDLHEPERLGLVVEAPDVRAAHDLITQRIDTTPGVLGTWPVALETDGADTAAEPPDRPTSDGPDSPEAPDEQTGEQLTA